MTAPDEVAALAGRRPAADPEDPYEDVDLSELADWWADAVREFEAHGLRPYRPPRFADGTPKHEVVERLEAEHGVEIRFVGYDATYGDDWTVLVDGEPAGAIARRRDPGGYTVFETPAEEFTERIERHLERAPR